MPGSRRKSASTQGHTYVIDQSYRVVYLDRAARRVFPGGRVGELCYECFRGQSEPCKDCPWNAESNEHATQSVIYSARTGSWYEITCLELDWFNEGPCVLFSGHPVDEHSRSLFTSLSEPSSYDELFELNLTDDAYKILYHEPGKFTTPPLEGRISDMFPDVRDRMIHPEDRLGTINRQGFDAVDLLLAFVVPLTHVAFGILVGEHRTGGLHDRRTHVVFRSNQTNFFVLAQFFLLNTLINFRILLLKMFHGYPL